MKNRITVSLNEDVHKFVLNKSENDPNFRNASHFVEYCIRSVMGIEKKELIK